MPRFNVVKIQARPENRIQEFPGVDVSTYEAKSPGAPGEVEIATVEADSLEAAQRMVEEIDRVRAVEPDFEVRQHGELVTEITEGEVESSGVPGSYLAADVVRHVGIDKLYAAGRLGQGETNGVIDSGYHLDSLRRLFGERLVGFEDFTGEGVEGPKGTHGTWCSIASTAPRSRLLVAKGLRNAGSGRTSDCIEGGEWLIRQGATHITASLGSQGESAAWRAFVEKAEARNVAFGASAGNEGCSGGDTVGSPGRYARYCTAAGDHRTDQPTGFSSCGPRVTGIAPGASVHLATGDPELDNKGWSGTSMSRPVENHGVLCLASGQHKPDEVSQAVFAKARDTEAPPNREGHGWFDGAAALASLQPNPAPAPAPTLARVGLSTLNANRRDYFGKDLTIFTQDSATSPKVDRWRATAIR